MTNCEDYKCDEVYLSKIINRSIPVISLLYGSSWCPMERKLKHQFPLLMELTILFRAIYYNVV